MLHEDPVIMWVLKQIKKHKILKLPIFLLTGIFFPVYLISKFIFRHITKLAAGGLICTIFFVVYYQSDRFPNYVGDGIYKNPQLHAMAETEAERQKMDKETITQKEETTRTEITDWRLLLVNKDRPLSANYEFTKRNLSNSYQVDERIYDDLNDMLRAGRKEGCVFIVCSAYRSYERQVERFMEDVKEYVDQGYSYEDACEETMKTLSLPGSSEHQTGLAVDIVAKKYQMLNEGYANTKEAIWLKEHAHEYGFIVRYPEDKVSITGIDYEPWHFRYVGVEAATQIRELGLCLEEYIEALETGTLRTKSKTVSGSSAKSKTVSGSSTKKYGR